MAQALKTCSSCKAEKPAEAFYARPNRPRGVDSHCKACRIAAHRTSKASADAMARWQAKHQDEIRDKRRQRESQSPEHMRALERKWYRANPERYARKRIERRQSVKQATPSWSNAFIVEEAYRLARLRTEKTGIKWHVDHIVPLKNELVCGLHAHTNVQVIPAAVNHRKSNRLFAEI